MFHRGSVSGSITFQPFFAQRQSPRSTTRVLTHSHPLRPITCEADPERTFNIRRTIDDSAEEAPHHHHPSPPPTHPTPITSESRSTCAIGHVWIHCRWCACVHLGGSCLHISLVSSSPSSKCFNLVLGTDVSYSLSQISISKSFSSSKPSYLLASNSTRKPTP